MHDDTAARALGNDTLLARTRLVYFSQALRAWKDEHDVSDEEIARLAGVRESTVRALRHGRRTPHLSTVLRFMQGVPHFAPLYLHRDFAKSKLDDHVKLDMEQEKTAG